MVAGIALAATLTFAGAGNADVILNKERIEGTNYCHMKFPAIKESTLSWRDPVQKAPSSGDIIDFYGPCNYDPDGELAAQNQQLQLQRERRVGT